MMKKPLIILGAGGHAKVLIETLQHQSANILGITDPDPQKIGDNILGIPIIGGDDLIFKHDQESIALVNGIGMVDDSQRRQQIFYTFKNQGYRFAGAIHGSAVISPAVKLSEGVQIMAGAVIQPGCKIGTNSIINSRASIDHDAIIGAHVHIASGATLSGGIKVNDGTLIGAGSTIIQGITIGVHCIVAAGAVVIRDVPDGATVMGVPAKVVEK
jgi:UDP-perosamine 4-acetyltransferase